MTFTHISWFTDKFGRKPAFYLAWIWLVVVRVSSTGFGSSYLVYPLGLRAPKHCQVASSLGFGQAM